MRPGHDAVLEVGADHAGEQPGADDVVRVGAQVHREDALPQVVVGLPAAGDVRAERGGGPGVHHVGVADEAAGLAALLLGVAPRSLGRRVDRQLGLARHQRVGVVGLAVAAQGVPDRERDAEEALPRDQPVTVEAVDPVVVAMAHVGGHPLDLGAVVDHLLAQAGVAATVAEVPLAGGHDLERLVALLVEVGLALGRGGLAVEVTGGAQLLHHRLPGRERRLALEVLVRRRTHPVGEPERCVAREAAVAADEGADGQVELAPPGDVGEVAERAGHRDAGALVDLGQGVGQHRDLDAEDRALHGGAEQRLVALVVGVGHQGDHAGDQLGPGGLDEDLLPVGLVEGDAVVVAGVVTRLELGLGHGGLEGDVPERRRLLEVGLAAGEVAQERLLADGLRLRTDRRVGLAPVDGEPEGAPQRLEDLLVLLDEALAELDEVGPADRDLLLRVGLLGRREVGVVREGRVAPDAVVVLDATLGRQAVVVPAHGVEDRLAAHPLEPRDQVGVGVGEDVADVQAAADGRRGSVDREHVGARLGAVEPVGVVGLPPRRPLVLEALERRLLRYDDGTLIGARRLRCLGVSGLGHGPNSRGLVARINHRQRVAHRRLACGNGRARVLRRPERLPRGCRRAPGGRACAQHRAVAAVTLLLRDRGAESAQTPS